MEDRFNFNAIVTGYYLNKNDDEIEIPITLKNVTVCSGGDIIGIEYYVVVDSLKEQYPEIEIEDVNKIMQFFEDNSDVYDDSYDYLTIKPDKIMQCTGVKCSGILLYEGDVMYLNEKKCIIRYANGRYLVHNLDTLQCLELTSELAEKLTFEPHACASI